MLIKEDFLPRRPDSSSMLAAAPTAAMALFACASPWIGGTEPLAAALLAEFPIFILVFFVAISRDNSSRFLRWFGIGWALVVASALTASMVFATKSVWPAIGLALVVGTNARTLIFRDHAITRSLMAARAAVGFALAWGTVFGAFVVLAVLRATPTDANMTAAWAGLFFGASALIEAFRILTPPPADAPPGWWRWNAPDRA